MSARSLARSLPFGIVAVLGGCEPQCQSTDPTCNDVGIGVPTYDLLLAEAPPSLSAIVFRVQVGGNAFDLKMTTNGLMTQAGSNAAKTEWRAVLLGRPTNFKLATLVVSHPGIVPVVTVEQASEGAANHYALLSPAMIKIEARPTNP